MPIILLVLYRVVGGNRSQCSDTLEAQSDVSLFLLFRNFRRKDILSFPINGFLDIEGIGS